METQNPRYYKFGEYKIDSRRRILTKSDVEIPISSKNFELLFELVKNEGRILSHNELLDTVWEGTFVEQSNLKKGISAIRQILGETPESSLYIKTVPRRGYCFISPVQTFSEETLPETIHVTATEIVIEEEIIEDDEVNSSVSTKVLPPSKLQTTSLWSRYKKPILVGLAILLLGMIAFGISKYFAPKGRRFSAESVKITKLTNDGNCIDASISADGNFILCGVLTNEGNTLITRQVSAKSQIQLLPPQKDVTFWAFKITPDGNSVYYMLHNQTDPSRDGLFQIPLLGGTPRKINNGALHITFSPDGKRFGFVKITPTTNQIITANTDGSDEIIIAEYGEGHRIWGLTWSPDGKTLLCSARLLSNEKLVGFVDEISISDGTKKKVFESDRLVVSATWMPDKSSIILGMREPNSEVRQIWQYFPNTKELIRVTNDNNTYRFPTLNQTGTIISVSQESTPGGFFQGELGNNATTPLFNGTGAFSHISRTGDGRFIFISVDDGSEAIWIMNPDGSNKRQITDGKDGIGLAPKLSNDRNFLVYASMRSGNKELWKINLDGSGLSQLTKSPEEMAFNGKLLSDGVTLIGSSTGKKGTYIWKQTANGNKTTIVENASLGWDVSPDDKLLVYDKYNQTTKQTELIVQSLETNNILQTFPTNTDYILQWVDSNSFIYQNQKDGRFQIFKQTLDKSPPKLIYEFVGLTNDRVPSFEFFPDGKRFVVIRAKYLLDAVTIKIDETK